MANESNQTLLTSAPEGIVPRLAALMVATQALDVQTW
jgi:hypothetical protein